MNSIHVSKQIDSRREQLKRKLHMIMYEVLYVRVLYISFNILQLLSFNFLCLNGRFSPPPHSVLNHCILNILGHRGFSLIFILQVLYFICEYFPLLILSVDVVSHLNYSCSHNGISPFHSFLISNVFQLFSVMMGSLPLIELKIAAVHRQRLISGELVGCCPRARCQQNKCFTCGGNRESDCRDDF